MRTVIKGKRYSFYVVANRMGFYIKAVHLASSRFSFINNLNAILSELDISMYDERVSESQWLMSKGKSSLFLKKAVGLLRDKDGREYIEEKLDEDRECGEW